MVKHGSVAVSLMSRRKKHEMAFTKSREEVLNVYLAECVGDTGLSTQAENIEMYASGKKAMPDVVVSFQGLRCIIEGKWADAAKGANPDAKPTCRHAAPSSE